MKHDGKENTTINEPSAIQTGCKFCVRVTGDVNIKRGSEEHSIQYLTKDCFYEELPKRPSFCALHLETFDGRLGVRIKFLDSPGQ